MLRLTDIHKRYGRLAVLEGLSLRLNPGEIYGLLGPSGAGKSTVLKVCTGLVRPDRGTVRIEGVDRRHQPALVRRLVGAQIGRPAFWGSLTLRENLVLLARLQDAPATQVDDLLSMVDLHGHAHHQAREASTGMRQRLGLAAALLGEPALLVLDEPTTGLDPQGRESLLGLIHGLATERTLTVLLTSHVFAEVATLCHRVGLLQRGRLVHEGPAGDARELRERYFAHTADHEEQVWA